MTKYSNKELTAEEKLDRIFVDWYGEEYEGMMYNEVLELIQSECKRFALECVPEFAEDEFLDDYPFNACREQMIKNIESKK